MNIKLKDIWWKGQDLNYIDENDKHVILKDANFTGHTMKFEPNDAVKVETLTFFSVRSKYDLFINCFSLGDTVCAIPIVRKLICDNPFKYEYIVHTIFPELFVPWIGGHSLFDWRKSLINPNNHYSAAFLNDNRLTAMHSVDYLSFTLGGTVLDDRSYPIYPVENIDISRFGIDFSKCIIVVPSWIKEHKKIDSNVIKTILDYILSIGFQPLLLGRNDNPKDFGKDLLSKRIVEGDWYSKYDKGIEQHTGVISLINKTTVLEAVKIISLSKLIIGADSGLIHLAGMTKTPIVVSHTFCNPKHRLPIRDNIVGKGCYVVVPPEGTCRFCMSKFLNAKSVVFDKCNYGHNECVKSIKSDMIINKIKDALDNKEDDSKKIWIM